jgi:hypothetical protein
MVPAVGRWKQEDEIGACLGYLAEPCLKNPRKKSKQTARKLSNVKRCKWRIS